MLIKSNPEKTEGEGTEGGRERENKKEGALFSAYFEINWTIIFCLYIFQPRKDGDSREIFLNSLLSHKEHWNTHTHTEWGREREREKGRKIETDRSRHTCFKGEAFY